jgi:hypothetical protein
MGNSLLCYQLLILLRVANILIAYLMVVMVDKLELHGIGSKLLEW